MNITIDCRMWGEHFGGIGRYTKEIVLYLIAHNDWEYTLLCSSDAYLEFLSYQRSNIHIVPCTAGVFSLKEQWEMWCKVPRCDVFWCPYINIPFVRTRAKKQVVTMHDVFHIANRQYYNRLKQWAIAPYYFFSTRRSDMILTVSQFSKDEIGKYFGDKVKGKVHVVYNGFGIDSRDAVAKQTGYRYFLFVGSIKPHKNLKNALLAFDKYDDHDFRFVVVGKKEGFITGDSEVFRMVERMNRDRERVIFTGNISDGELYGWYMGASALVMPSLYEGFGLPLVEAMHFNIPIICSDIPVFHELCHDKVIYFNPLDPCDIAEQMRVVTTLSSASYPKWRNWTTAAEETERLLMQLNYNR